MVNDFKNKIKYFFCLIQILIISPYGLLVAQGDRISFYEKRPTTNEYKYHTLLIESQIMSCYYEPQTKHILVSSRPSEKHPIMRQLVYELDKNVDTNELRLNQIVIFKGSNEQKFLARSKLFALNAELYGCSSCEKNKCVQVWNVSNGRQCAKLMTNGAVIDVLPVKFRNDMYVCSLTEKQLKIFKLRV